MNELEVDGYWHLAEDQSHTVPGQMRHTPDYGTRLETFGSLLPPDAPDKIPSLVIGTIDDSRFITLYKCISYTTPRAAVSAQYQFQIALPGLRITDPSELLFPGMIFQLSEFAEWIHNSLQDQLIASEKADESRLTILEVPFNPEVRLVVFCKRIAPVTTFSDRGTAAETTARTAYFLELASDKDLHLEHWLDLLHMARRFFAFVFRRAVYQVSLKGVTPADVEGSRWTFPVFAMRPHDEPALSHNRDHMPFFDLDLLKLDPQLLSRWIERYSTLRPCYDLYFERLYTETHTGRYGTLAIVGALEYYHRNVHSPSQILRNRLRDLIERHRAILDDYIPDSESFIQLAVDTRNYFVHHDDKLLPRKADNTELWDLNGRLKLLLDVCLLSDTGLPNAEVKKAVRRIYGDTWDTFYFLTS